MRLASCKVLTGVGGTDVSKLHAAKAMVNNTIKKLLHSVTTLYFLISSCKIS